MGALLKMVAGGLMNPAQMPETFAKLGRKLYVVTLAVIASAWYTGWLRLRGNPKGDYSIPGLAKKVQTNATNLSTLPGLQPFKAVLSLVPDVTDATGSSGGATLAPPTNLGKMPGSLGTQEINILQAGRLAQRMGLRVSENPLFGGVTPGAHAPGSLHYSGRAIDVSAPMTKQGQALMAQYAQIMASNYGARLTELFWRGPNWIIIKNGQRQANYKFVDGHLDHVHVGI